MLSMFTNKNLIFKHADGVIDKESREVLATKPNEAIMVLNERYDLHLTQEILSNYFNLREYIETNLNEEDYNNIIATYLKILDKTRCDIPDDLQDVWVQRKDELGLTGKFLPESSKLCQV